MKIPLLLVVMLVGCANSFGQSTEKAAAARTHSFLDKTNLAAFSDETLMRGMDAQSTRSFETNRCGCLHEVLLPNFIVKSTPMMYSYSLAVAGSNVGLAYLAHRLNHHKIERWIPRIDIGQETYYVIHNRHQIEIANQRR